MLEKIYSMNMRQQKYVSEIRSIYIDIIYIQFIIMIFFYFCRMLLKRNKHFYILIFNQISKLT